MPLFFLWLCIWLAHCHGDSGGPYWKTKENKDSKESISTVLSVVSQGPENCLGSGIATKIAHRDVLKWISQNWEK